MPSSPLQRVRCRSGRAVSVWVQGGQGLLLPFTTWDQGVDVVSGSGSNLERSLICPCTQKEGFPLYFEIIADLVAWQRGRGVEDTSPPAKAEAASTLQQQRQQQNDERRRSQVTGVAGTDVDSALKTLTSRTTAAPKKHCHEELRVNRRDATALKKHHRTKQNLSTNCSGLRYNSGETAPPRRS